VYFSILSDVIDFVAGGFSPASIVYSETDFWKESYSASTNNRLMELASYQSNPNANLRDIYLFKTAQEEIYKTKYPERYKSMVDWINRPFQIWLKYYKLSILWFLIFILILFMKFIRKANTKGMKYWKLLVVLILGLLAIGFTRYKAEYYTEKRLDAELAFTIDVLEVDGTKILNQQQLEQVNCNAYRDHVQFDSTGSSNFWLSRLIEEMQQEKGMSFPRVFGKIPLNEGDAPSSCSP
jgi:hypothetical protein